MTDAKYESPDDGGVSIAARTIPAPRSISLEARRSLARFAAIEGVTKFPSLDDAPGWRAHIEAYNAAILRDFVSSDQEAGVECRTRIINGVTVYDVAPTAATATSERIYMELHGGALIYLQGEGCRLAAISRASRTRMRTLAVDYRVPPDHPYPAALDDCLAVYEHLLKHHSPADIVIGGASAGGNLAAATILRARDAGLPLPAAAVLLTPELDLTESGDTFETNRDIDVVLKRGQPILNALYAGGHQLSDPYLSPLFADFSRGFPRCFLQSGTRDLFLSNTVRMHRALLRAGRSAELHVFEAMPHAGFFGAPEDEDLAMAIRGFLQSLWAGDSASQSQAGF